MFSLFVERMISCSVVFPNFRGDFSLTQASSASGLSGTQSGLGGTYSAGVMGHSGGDYGTTVGQLSQNPVPSPGQSSDCSTVWNAPKVNFSTDAVGQTSGRPVVKKRKTGHQSTAMPDQVGDRSSASSKPEKIRLATGRRGTKGRHVFAGPRCPPLDVPHPMVCMASIVVIPAHN